MAVRPAIFPGVPDGTEADAEPAFQAGCFLEDRPTSSAPSTPSYKALDDFDGPGYPMQLAPTPGRLSSTSSVEGQMQREEPAHRESTVQQEERTRSWFTKPTMSLPTRRSKFSLKPRRISRKNLKGLTADEVRELILGVEELQDDEEDSLDDSWRSKAHWLVEHRYFQMVISAVIFMNALYIGIETDANKDVANLPVSHGIEIVFVLVFLVEILLRLAVGRRFFCGTTWNVTWNLFDLGLIVIGCLDLFFMTPVFGSKADDLEAWAVLRILRVLRLAHVFRLLSWFHEFWLIVAGVFDAMRTLVWAWLLLGLLLYIFGVFFTGSLGQVYGNESCNALQGSSIGDLFGSVFKSMFTLFAVMTINSWADITRCAMQEETWTWVIFVIFLMCTSFGMLNVVVAVIVESTLERATKQHREEKQQEDKKRRETISQVYDLFRSSDTDGDGLVTRQEFMTALQQTDVMRKLMIIGIDVRKAKNLFDILDYDGSGSLDVQEFIHGMMRARGEAQAKDVLALQCDITRSAQTSSEELLEIQDRFMDRMDPIDAEIEALHIEVRQMIRALERDRNQHDEPVSCESARSSCAADFQPQPQGQRVLSLDSVRSMEAAELAAELQAAGADG